jgi:predicted metal-binding transcription factor (methanogenesis marker protein 9)
MNEKLKNLAEKIRKLANIPEDENFGSVMAILMIISIIFTLVRVLQECNKNKLKTASTPQDKYALYGSEIKNCSIRRGWFTKMRVKKILREKMSREQYNKYNKALLEAIFNTGENLTDEEVVTLVENANV